MLRICGCLVLALLAGCGLIMDSSDRLERGEEALAEGDFRAAIIDAKDVLLKEPDNLRGRLLLGRASVEAGDGPAAEKELRRAISLGEPFANVAAGLGRSLVSQGKFSEALSEIPLEGLPSDEATATARLVHGDAHMGLGDAEAARELYTSVLELAPDNLDARLGIATTHIAEGNVAQAGGAIETILQTDADNPRVWLYSGAFNASNRNFETAVANYRVATELSLKNGDSASLLQARTGLAESLLEQGDDAAARKLVDQLVASSPDALQTKSLVARIAYIDEDWTTAQQNLQQILQVAPNYWPAQLLLGAVHFRSGNLSHAEMYLSSAVAASPDNVRARQMLAEVWLSMRKT
ncbi:MAG: tetratricopeptide repeat protein, partial [Woeseia sp.]